MSFVDEWSRPVDMRIEEMSRNLVSKYVKPHHHVLEFGARYGTVSVFLSKMLERGEHLVSVEPDPNVIPCLKHNRDANGASFHIVHGVCSNEKQYLVHHPCVWEQKTYADPSAVLGRRVCEIKNYSVRELEDMHSLRFNVLVADCEGYLIEFFNDNKEFIRSLDVLIYEEDCTSSHPINGHSVDYSELETFLKEHNFVCAEDLVDAIGLHNKVFIRKTE
jgi:FkbM family methyltransferase